MPWSSLPKVAAPPRTTSTSVLSSSARASVRLASAWALWSWRGSIDWLGLSSTTTSATSVRPERSSSTREGLAKVTSKAPIARVRHQAPGARRNRANSRIKAASPATGAKSSHGRSGAQVTVICSFIGQAAPG
ncbi:MAG: hypothetical protein AAF495_27865 [Pseudomonadota bacterium]